MVGERWQGLDEASLQVLLALAEEHQIPLLIEADGSRMLPLKAPAAHEPAIPGWVKMVVVVAGMSGLGKPFSPETVHRMDHFAGLSGLKPGERISVEALARVLAHPQGGLKHIPDDARRIALLNQADSPDQRLEAGRLADLLVGDYHAAVIASLHNTPDDKQVYSVREPTAGVVLAAGGSRRLAQPKQLLTWRGEPFIRHVVRVGLEAGLKPLIVVVGANGDRIQEAVQDYPVTVIHNPDWADGQSTSVQAGIGAVPAEAGSAVFLLADQPHLPVEYLRQVIEHHHQTLAPVVAPRVQGKRANPVLFDRKAFPAFASLAGDVGGRAVIERFPVEWVEWDDPTVLLDVDTQDDYQRLLELE
jgi:molybdenum cofactor cytidylyltransferase